MTASLQDVASAWTRMVRAQPTVEEAARALTALARLQRESAPFRLPPEELRRVPLAHFLGLVSAEVRR